MNPYSRIKLKKNIMVCGSLSVVFIMGFLCVVLFGKVMKKEEQYFIPFHDEYAVEGLPEDGVTQELLPRDGMHVGVRVPAIYGENRLKINLVNYADNNVHLSVILYDEQKRMLAESGRIYNGEYLPFLVCKEELDPAQNYMLKIIAFHNEEMTSEGSVWVRVGIDKE